ncbi:MAG: transglutaminase family protein [Faecalibacterium sp.]
MKNLFFESTTTLQFDSPVVDHHFLLRCLPASFAGQRIVSATLQLSPAVPYTLSCDGFGNLNETGCIKFPHTEFIYKVSGLAQINEEERQRERLHPIFTHPSHYTTVSPEMNAFLAGLALQGGALEQAVQLADAVYHAIAYQSGSTCTATTAAQAFAGGQGVCQDFSHIFIALARKAGIPARYANGLPLGEGQSHAWCEVYADGMWQGIDPTRNRLIGEDYVRFCIGRDFGDCALERGVLFGSANQTQNTITQVIEQ